MLLHTFLSGAYRRPPQASCNWRRPRYSSLQWINLLLLLKNNVLISWAHMEERTEENKKGVRIECFVGTPSRPQQDDYVLLHLIYDDGYHLLCFRMEFIKASNDLYSRGNLPSRNYQLHWALWSPEKEGWQRNLREHQQDARVERQVQSNRVSIIETFRPPCPRF